ncbi:MAG: hypothetical protein HY071_03675 [Chloroflexi bacterium]|nr:hypothetical protein [Chloroflexota bacterium]
MARIVVAALLLVLAGPILPARAASIDSAYRFESAFVTGLRPGDTAQFSVFFDNTGASAWVSGTATQVNLGICRSDQVTCNVTSDKAAWNPGSWTTATAYATQAKSAVPVGDFTAFSYSVKVPAGTPQGRYRFNGDLVLAGSGTSIHPEGYYQDATVIAPPSGAAAPADVRATAASLDGGPTQNDVRVQFTAPAANTIRGYEIQRTQGRCPITATSPAWLTLTTVSVLAGQEAGYTDFDVKSGDWCYQVRAQDPSTNAFAYSNQANASIFGGATGSGSATSTSAKLVNSSGDAGSLDAGDIVTIVFSQAMIVSTFATIQITDADCGAPASQSSGPAACNTGSSQTISTISCGINATCVLSFDGLTLNITMSAPPTDAQSGSAPGSQFPVDITASSGITDRGSAQWQIAGSADRVFGPLGN